MADTYTPILEALLQETGNNSNNWIGKFNADTVTILENAVAGHTRIGTWPNSQRDIALFATRTQSTQFKTSMVTFYDNGSQPSGTAKAKITIKEAYRGTQSWFWIVNISYARTPMYVSIDGVSVDSADLSLGLHLLYWDAVQEKVFVR